MPIYKIVTTITEPSNGTAVCIRMIGARNRAAAVAHVVKDSINVEQLDSRAALKLQADGIEFEELADE